MKQERDAAFYDLEGLKMDEEGQRDAFQGDVDFWKGEVLIAIANDDDEYFLEANKFREEALKNVEKAQAKLDATAALYEVERAGKEQRDRDQAVKEAMAIFNERSTERKNAFDNIDGQVKDAVKNLQDNAAEIQRLEGELQGDPDNTTL